MSAYLQTLPTNTSPSHLRSDYSAALRIVRDVPKLGCEGACRIYGAAVIGWALRTVRAEVARKQSKRARTKGAGFKRVARRWAKRGAYAPLIRDAEALSRAHYRKAAAYDRTVSRCV